MNDYEPPLVDVIASSNAETALTELAASGWTPWKDSPLALVARAVSFGQAATSVAAVNAADSQFETTVAAFGRSQREAVAAKLQATVEASDSGDYELKEGSVFILTTPSGDVSLWTTVEAVDLVGGTTDPGEVQMTSNVAGDEFNDLTGTLTLYAPIETWFGSAETAAPSSNGVAAEGAVEYRDAGTRYLRSIIPRPVIAEDWEAFALDADTAIKRVMVIENFDPTDTTDGPDGTEKGGHFVLALGGTDGLPVGVDPKANVEAIPRLSDVVLHIIDPDIVEINVAMTVVRRAEYSSAQTEAAVEAAIQAWLDPNLWGSAATGEQASWHPERVVRIKEAEAVAVRPVEVHYVDPSVDVTLQVVGVDGSPQTTDRTLAGLAPLASAGTVTVTVLDPA